MTALPISIGTLLAGKSPTVVAAFASLGLAGFAACMAFDWQSQRYAQAGGSMQVGE